MHILGLNRSIKIHHSRENKSGRYSEKDIYHILFVADGYGKAGEAHDRSCS